MSTTTNAALIVMNTSLTQQAADDARKAHFERCKAELLTYQSKGATVIQMQSYAACVNTVYPENVSNDVLTAKALVIFIILSTAVGAAVGWKQERAESALLLSVVGFVIGSAGAGAYVLGRWLVS